MHTEDMACLTSSTVALSGTCMSKEFEYAGSSTWMTTVGTDMAVVTVNDSEGLFCIRGGHVLHPGTAQGLRVCGRSYMLARTPLRPMHVVQLQLLVISNDSRQVFKYCPGASESQRINSSTLVLAWI